MKEPDRSSTPNGTTAIGINHNVTVKGSVFHIQTEDLGTALAQVVTHVFAEGGQVVKVARLDYSRHLDSPNLSSALPKVVRAHHQAVTRKLLAGALDSLPELLVLRPSTEAEKAQMTESSTESEPAPRSNSYPPTPTGTKKRERAAIKRGPSNRPKRSPASLWNLLVQDAHRVRRATSQSDDRDEDEEPPPSSHAWDQAVERARSVGHKPAHPALGSAADPSSSMAEAIFTRGERLEESRDFLGALSCFAHCVHIEPKSPRYRAALRRALERVDG